MMKKLIIPTLVLCITASWMACKDAPEVAQEAETEMIPTADSLFIVQQARESKNLAAYSNGIYEKVVGLEKSLTSASGAEKDKISAEIDRLRAMIARINEVQAEVSKARSEEWESIYADLQDLKYDVKTELSNQRPSKERAGEMNNN